MNKIVIAIDGYSGTGKSSTAKVVAQHLSYAYVDSGAMYRAVTLYCLDHEIEISDRSKVEAILPIIDIHFEVSEQSKKSVIFLNGQEVENQIREPRVSNQVSLVAAIPAVRKLLVSMQQHFGEGKGIVMDGRDIGTVVFPQAELKIFMTADVHVRAKRRLAELNAAGIAAKLDEIENNLKERDHLDTTRSDSPLVKADDAIEIDSTSLTFDEQVDKIVTLANELIGA